MTGGTCVSGFHFLPRFPCLWGKPTSGNTIKRVGLDVAAVRLQGRIQGEEEVDGGAILGCQLSTRIIVDVASRLRRVAAVDLTGRHVAGADQAVANGRGGVVAGHHPLVSSNRRLPTSEQSRKSLPGRERGGKPTDGKLFLGRKNLGIKTPG